MSYINNLTLHHGGLLSLKENSRTGNEQAENDFKFDFIDVQYGGTIQMLSNPATHPGMNLTVTVLEVEGGGKVEGNDLRVLAQNISINTEGLFTLDGNGYNYGHGSSMGIHGQTNKGFGRGTDAGASGGGHGGTGGRGKNMITVGLPYGNLYEPTEFGSSGGGQTGKAGNGIILKQRFVLFKVVILNHLEVSKFKTMFIYTLYIRKFYFLMKR